MYAIAVLNPIHQNRAAGRETSRLSLSLSLSHSLRWSRRGLVVLVWHIVLAGGGEWHCSATIKDACLIKTHLLSRVIRLFGDMTTKTQDERVADAGSQCSYFKTATTYIDRVDNNGELFYYDHMSSSLAPSLIFFNFWTTSIQGIFKHVNWGVWPPVNSCSPRSPLGWPPPYSLVILEILTFILIFIRFKMSESRHCHISACSYWYECLSLWPSGIGSRLGRNRLWVRFLAVSDIYPMFIEPTINWVPSGFSGYIWLDTKIVFKNVVTYGQKS